MGGEETSVCLIKETLLCEVRLEIHLRRRGVRQRPDGLLLRLLPCDEATPQLHALVTFAEENADATVLLLLLLLAGISEERTINMVSK